MSQSTTEANCSQTDTDCDAAVQSNSDSCSVTDPDSQRPPSEPPTTDDVMQTAEDVLDDLNDD